MMVVVIGIESDVGEHVGDSDGEADDGSSWYALRATDMM